MLVIGTRIKINPDLAETYRGSGVTPPMLSYAGRIATIVGYTGVCSQGDDCYRIGIDNNNFVWNEFMFEVTPMSPEDFYEEVLETTLVG